MKKAHQDLFLVFSFRELFYHLSFLQFFSQKGSFFLLFSSLQDTVLKTLLTSCLSLPFFCSIEFVNSWFSKAFLQLFWVYSSFPPLFEPTSSSSCAFFLIIFGTQMNHWLFQIQHHSHSKISSDIPIIVYSLEPSFVEAFSW